MTVHQRRRVRSCVLPLALVLVLLTACTGEDGRPQPSGRDGIGLPRDTESQPGRTIRLEVGDDIQAAVDASGSRSTFLIASGTHRLQRIRPRDGNTFIGEDGAVLSGARVLTEFERRENRWVATDQTQSGFAHGTTLPGRERSRHPEGLWLDDQRQVHVGSIDRVIPGTWFFDYPTDEIWIGSDPRGSQVETSVTEYAFVGAGARHVRISNLIVERYANRAQRGAINPHGSPDWLIEDVVVRDNHGAGVGVGPGMRLERALIHHNGQIGIAGSAPADGLTQEPVVIRDVTLHSNGGIGYDWRWEAGGTKFKEAAYGVHVERLHSYGNVGPGLWFDIDNRGAQITDSLIEDNTGPGIFYEISFGQAIIQDNESSGNGSDDHGVEVRISSSSGVTLQRNDITATQIGVFVEQGDRGDNDQGEPFLTEDIAVVGNHVRAPIGVTLQMIESGRLREDLSFRGNTYVSSDGEPVFDLDGQLITIDEWVGLGASEDRAWRRP